MWHVRFSGGKEYPLDRPLLAAGRASSFDLPLEGADGKLLFTLRQEAGDFYLDPQTEKISRNGQAIRSKEKLGDGDRLDWAGGFAVILKKNSHPAAPVSADLSSACFRFYQTALVDLSQGVPVAQVIHSALAQITKWTGAEQGYLIGEEKENSWEIMAAVQGEGSGSHRKALLSNTVVNEAIRSQKPVHVANLVGHPWNRNASLMGVPLQSVCCLPLILGSHVLGALYLTTETSGRAIVRKGLEEIQTFAVLLMMLQASQEKQKRSIRSALKRFVYDANGPMPEILSRVAKLAASDLGIIIHGETGSGKELIAREIHAQSPRSKGPFVAINCGALPESLVESILFGYVKGAFTGAMKDTTGKFVEANGGTLFLDEIAELSLPLQVKLLRALQEKVVEPVGSHKAVPVDFRVIAATHADLKAKVKEGQFREDLLYRIEGAQITLPALRDRRNDICPLADAFLEPGKSFSKEARAALLSYPWPGNVRELQQVVKRACALSADSEIQAADLELTPRTTGASAGGAQAGTQDLRSAQDIFTRNYVQQALQRSHGNRAQAAQFLGISERTLYRLLAEGTEADANLV